MRHEYFSLKYEIVMLRDLLRKIKIAREGGIIFYYFFWIPRSSRGMTKEESCGGDEERRAWGCEASKLQAEGVCIIIIFR